jgi:hypothetical protein
MHQQAFRIDENVPLLALDLFSCVVARRIDRSPPFSALLTLWLSITAAVGLASRPMRRRGSDDNSSAQQPAATALLDIMALVTCSRLGHLIKKSMRVVHHDRPRSTAVFEFGSQNVAREPQSPLMTSLPFQFDDEDTEICK